MLFSDFNLSKCPDGLLPVIIQHATTLKVLMLGYMNEEAFQRTQTEKRVTFYSRTRQCLWTKGETSGNFIEVVQMYPDCDKDTLLIMGRPAGPACHRGTVSCFDTPVNEGFIRHLQGVIQGRHAQMPEGSYTTYLFQKGIDKILKKIGEESTELIIASKADDKKETVYEIADLAYHIMVMLVEMGIPLEDVRKELASRHIIDHKVKQEKMTE